MQHSTPVNQLTATTKLKPQSTKLCCIGLEDLAAALWPHPYALLPTLACTAALHRLLRAVSAALLQLLYYVLEALSVTDLTDPGTPGKSNKVSQGIA
jgi:hypothetical protein